MNLDAVDYSPIDHINSLFPSSKALNHLRDVSEYVELYKLSVLRQNQSQGDIDAAAFQNAAQLMGQVKNVTRDIHDLRNSGKTTEAELTAMTADIKKLDHTKTNLIQSVTVLKRLQMLQTAHNQLSSLVPRRAYKEIAQTMPAIMELMDYFRQFRSISQIAQLSKQVAEIETKVVEQVRTDFTKALEGGASSAEVVSGQLVDGCLVIESLSTDEKTNLISWYCTVKLREYRKIFTSGDEAGSLENISRRYAYLKRLLKSCEEEEPRYFPSQWKVSHALAERFCEDTRNDINVTLSGYGGDSTAGSSSSRGATIAHSDNNSPLVDMQVLLTALRDTIEFEQYLNRRLKTKSAFTGAISHGFQQHLGLWIQHQDKILFNKFQQYRAEDVFSGQGDTATPDLSETPPGQASGSSTAVRPAASSSSQVMPSSADLFLCYRQTLTQTARLSTGKPLVDLANLFAKWLDTYCKHVLQNKVPDRLITDQDIDRVSIVLNTADYCRETTTQLEQKLAETADPEFQDKISLESERSQFLQLVNVCISRLVEKVELGCDYAWREMANTNWSKLDAVGDQSGYVSELCSSLSREAGPVLSKITKDTYRRLICDKIVDRVMATYLQNMTSSRPIPEVAAEQMLLDIYVIRECFLKLPQQGLSKPQFDNDPESNAQSNNVSAVYTRHVTKSILRTETILKLILTQSQPPEGLVQNYFYLIGDKSGVNFCKILELKGITRSQQTRFLELFNSHLKAHDNLVNDSPILSSLHIRSVPSQRVSSANPHANTIKENFERLTHGAEAPVNKLNENFRSFGRFFRRDGNGPHSPGR